MTIYKLTKSLTKFLLILFVLSGLIYTIYITFAKSIRDESNKKEIEKNVTTACHPYKLFAYKIAEDGKKAN